MSNLPDAREDTALRCVEFVSDKSAATLAAPNVSSWVKESQPDDCARSNRRGAQ
jgi:hypothetical protein